MKNLRVTAMVAGALVGGLVLGGVGIAAAAMRPMTSPTGQTPYGSVEATQPMTIPSGDTTQPMTVPSDDTTLPMTPPSGDTTQPMTPPSGDTTPSMTPTDTPRPPMPVQAHGHAYGRMISHPHSGLHRGRGHAAAMHAVNAARHASGSMMGR